MVNATKHILEPKAKGAPSLKGVARSGDRLEASSSHTILSALCVGMRPEAPSSRRCLEQSSSLQLRGFVVTTTTVCLETLNTVGLCCFCCFVLCWIFKKNVGHLNLKPTIGPFEISKTVSEHLRGLHSSIFDTVFFCSVNPQMRTKCNSFI